MFKKYRIFSTAGRFVAGLLLGLAAAFAPVHAQLAPDTSWHEMRFILDWGVDAPYFSFRCYTATGRGVNSWQNNKPKGIYYKCSGKDGKRPGYAIVQLKSPFFQNTGRKMRPQACLGPDNKHSCIRIKEKRGRVSADQHCSNSC